MKRILQRSGVVAFWLVWPALWVYLRWSRRTRLALVADGKILVVRGWLSDGRWQLPGGGLHTGESPVDGLLREVWEETGIRLSPGDLSPLGSEWFKGRGLRFRSYYFVAHMKRPVPTRITGPEIAHIRWLPLSDVRPETCGQDVVRALELLDGKG